MEQINLPEFLSLFGYTRVDDCWLSTDCIIDESGIKAKHSDRDTPKQWYGPLPPYGIYVPVW